MTTPLQYAIDNNHINAVALLLHHGANASITMMDKAVNDNNDDLIELLSLTAPINTYHLIVTCKNQNVGMMELLLKHAKEDIDINTLNDDEDTLLYSICTFLPATWHIHKPMILLLLNNGLDPNIYSQRHEHIIFRSIDNNEIDIVRILLTNDPNVINVGDHYDRSPLYHAAWYNKPDIVDLLLANNADPHHRYKKNAPTPLDIAIYSNNHTIVDKLNHV